MKIITGYTGTPHVTSNAAQGFNQGVIGSGNYMLDVGNKFAAVLTDATTVTISDGEGVMQGVHFRIDPGTSESVTIQSGTAGYDRIDLICARYTKDAVTGIEAVNLVVLTGTPSATPVEPAYTQGDILGGDTLAEFPLYEVDVNGLTPHIQRLARIKPVPNSIETLFNLSGTASVASSGSYAQSLTLEKGVWLLEVDFTMSFASGTFAAADYVSFDGPFDMQVNVGGTSGEANVHGCGLFSPNGTTSFTIINGTSKAATLQSFTVKGVRIA